MACPRPHLAITAGCGALLLLPGCFDNRDATIPGDPLGSYHVQAALQPSSCGEGALGAPVSWEFDVQLSREPSKLYWLNGQAPIEGTLSKALAFVIDSESVVEVFAATKTQAGCAVHRRDHASGTLASGDVVQSFEGTLEYSYAPTSGSACGSLVGVPGGFATLPCNLVYDLTATRTGD